MPRQAFLGGLFCRTTHSKTVVLIIPQSRSEEETVWELASIVGHTGRSVEYFLVLPCGQSLGEYFASLELSKNKIVENRGERGET